jgi:hypothetical protein
VLEITSKSAKKPTINLICSDDRSIKLLLFRTCIV